MNNKQMLEQFSDNFVKFRNSFHDILNENYASEINNPVDDLYDKSVDSITQHEQELEAKKQELANLSTNVNMTSEEFDYQKTKLEAEIKDLEDRKKIDQEYVAENEEKYYGDREEMRNKLKTCVETMRKAIGAQDVFGTTMSRIDVLKAEIESQIKSLSYQMQTLILEEKDAKGMDEKKDLRVQRAKLAAESGRLTALLDSLNDFTRVFDNLEKYVENNEILEHWDLMDFSEKLEPIANGLVSNVDKTLISVNIISKPDGTYSLDMRCGNRMCDPSPIIKAEDFSEATINDYITRFAYNLATKTPLNYDDLVNSKVILKSDGMNLGRHDFKTVGEMAELVKDGKRDQVLAAVGMSNPNQPTGPDNGQTPPVQGDGNQPTGPDNGQNPPVPGDGNQPTGPDNGQNPPVPGSGQNPTGPDNGQNPPVPGSGQNPTGLDDAFDFGGEENTQVALPKVEAHAMKVNSVRNARSKFFNSFRAITGTAAIGLGIAGMALGTGMVGPLVAGGLFAAGTVYEGYVKIKENIKYGALKHKLKKIAKKMSKEANLDIKFEMDPETRRAGFKLEGSDEFLTTSDLHQSEDFADGMDDIVVDIFENSFKRANKYRGKGESANSLKEVRYKDFPQITFDNVTAAFEEFGGVKTRRELNDYQFDYNKIIQARIEEQDNFVESNDNISEVDIDLDELEAMEAYAQSGQQPAPVSGQAPTGPDNGQQPAPGSGQDPQGPDSGQNPPTPVVAQPLAPSSQDPNVVQVQFPQADQDQLKAELADWIRSEVQDSTNGIAVADKLEEAIVGRKDELSEQSKVDLVNLFHDEVKFTEGQMERFDFICRNDRTLTDFEVKEAIAELEQVRATQGETQLGMAVSAFINGHENLTKEDLEALHRFDTSKNMGFEEAINSKFNGQGPTK